eukprot:CAMPEP_0197527088 /NCGR_PEP_ID=MMETSP1318-20131121/20267_1 /TAXON_ID=552666 /ORGANISM="Partenskyella glossopodia, Strain RCC365" /LENGTH=427 /DNA_ID=CAMNT_0043081549 /DNA_START=106 /DNA_END=1389 /DNA_ORIENTATION=-
MSLMAESALKEAAEAKLREKKNQAKSEAKKRPYKWESSALSGFMRDLKAELAKQKLKLDATVAKAILNPFNVTHVVDLDAKWRDDGAMTRSNVSNAQIKALIATITDKHPNAFQSLDFAHNSIDDKLAMDIAAILVRSQSIKSLGLAGNNIGRKGCGTLTQTLLQEKGAYLEHFSLRNNPIGDEPIRALADFLRTNPPLKSLDIGNTEAGIRALVHVAVAAGGELDAQAAQHRPAEEGGHQHGGDFDSACQESQEKHHSHPPLDEKTQDALARDDVAQQHISEWNQNLTHLSLDANEIDADGALHIARALASETCKLQELTLQANRITDEGAVHIARSLRTNTSLLVLDLSYTNLSDRGLVALSEALGGGNSSLRVLKLAGNLFNLGAKEAWQRLLGWPLDRANPTHDAKHSLDIQELDFIPLIAPL